MSDLRICVIGDIIGKPGRLAVMHALPDLRTELELDMVIANGENTAAGAGLTPSLAEELLGGGIDVITSGNHIWDKREIYDYLDGERPVLRPINYPDEAPGRGWLPTRSGDRGSCSFPIRTLSPWDGHTRRPKSPPRPVPTSAALVRTAVRC